MQNENRGPFRFTHYEVGGKRYRLPIELEVVEITFEPRIETVVHRGPDARFYLDDVGRVRERTFTAQNHPENHPKKCPHCSLTPDLDTRAN